MIQKLRRQSVRASSIKDKFGLGSKSSTFRSKSFVVPMTMPEGRDRFVFTLTLRLKLFYISIFVVKTILLTNNNFKGCIFISIQCYLFI